jgi:flagellar biosynthetic protein FliQ
MDALMVGDMVRETCIMILKVSAPVLGVSFVVGLVISLFQALTQIQESTISFVPKLTAILITVFLAFDFMVMNLTKFTHMAFDRIVYPTGTTQ